MRLKKSLNLSTLQEHIPGALIYLSTFVYIQLFINIIIKSGVLFKAFVLLKIQCDFWLVLDESILKEEK